MYKLYCSILNQRLSTWAEAEGNLCDEQSGFRKGRSTIDQLTTLTSVIESRIRAGKQTYCAFIYS
jgi:hypothetical protein